MAKTKEEWGKYMMYTFAMAITLGASAACMIYTLVFCVNQIFTVLPGF